MTNITGHFHYDASNRLTYEVRDLESDSYASTCDRIVTKFGLLPAGDLFVGHDEIFRDYTDGQNVIGLEWDNWSGFIVVAKSTGAEDLVRSIAALLLKL